MRTNLSFKFKAALAILLFSVTTATALWSQVTISGRVLARGTTPMEGVAVILSGTANEIAMTDSNGEYHFNVPAGGAYSVRPFANAYPLNGVSTFDMVLIGKHINGEELLDSPYKIIAADVDYTETLDSNDINISYDLILGITTNFPNEESWRFVRADYVFPDPQHPFPFPNDFVAANLSANVDSLDFIGVKLGDVNNTAIVLSGTGISFVDDSFFASKIVGSVRFDENTNCVLDPGEPPLEDWVVVAQESNGQQFYATTQANGAFKVSLPPGTYDVALFKPNGLWEICADTVFDVQVGVADTIAIDFAAQAVSECPYMEVDLSAPFLRRCFDNTYTVFYSNKGTVTEQNASVEVEFDPFMTVVSSTIPWSSVNGNTYTFELGEVSAGERNNFKVKVNLSCDADLGQTHCSEAHIFPDTLCGEQNPLWDGSNLVIEGVCQNGEVIFTITNTGQDMTEPVECIVIEDIMIQKSNGDDIFLAAGESQTITLPGNGATWRLEVPQVPNHPWNTFVTAAVEGCGENSTGTFSLGFVTLFPNGYEADFMDEDCQENLGSYDPNDKQGFPQGVSEKHYIPKDTEIEYLIRFQNTGTDTAFSVMILDTLSEHLDIATLRPGGGSHPYNFNMIGPGVAQFVFPNIMLPDSNVNEQASHGYVKFSIKPKADLPNNTIIKNQAAIFFDFNEPVITNQTLHTLGEQFLNVSTVVFRPGVELEVYPNPASVRATFFIKSATPTTGTLQLFDLQGKLIRTQPFATNTFELDAKGLPPGMYMFRLESEGHPIAAGKIIVQRHE